MAKNNNKPESPPMQSQRKNLTEHVHNVIAKSAKNNHQLCHASLASLSSAENVNVCFMGAEIEAATKNLLLSTEHEARLQFYNFDIETEEGVPSEAINFSNDLESADAYIISLAEHNGSYTTAFKNAYDWASRVNKKVWGDKPLLLFSSTEVQLVSPKNCVGKTLSKNAGFFSLFR